MTEWNDLDNPELKKLFRKHIIRGTIFLFILIGFIFLLALSLEPQLREVAEWLRTNFGIWGLGAIVFFADLIISPIPPDVVLFIISKSSLHQSWFILVPFFGVISTVAGVCGWLIGQRLQHISFVKRFIQYFGDEHRASIQRFGFWMVVLGAVTPLPFSVTCWLAGIFKLPFKTFIVACLCRIPRFLLYYWAIFYSGEIGSLLRSLL